MNLTDIAFLARSNSAAGAVTPTSYANLMAWWKADSLSLSDATPVGNIGTEWISSDASVNQLANPTAGQRPLYKTSIINGQPVVRFDGSDDFLFMSAALALLTSDYTFIVIGTAPSGTDGQFIGYSSNVQFRINRAGANQISQFLGVAEVISITMSNASTSARQMGWRRNGTSIKLRENKTDITSGSPTDGTSFTVDRVGKTSFGGQLNGDIGEIVIYNAFRSNAEMDALYDGYFKPKWGLP